MFSAPDDRYIVIEVPHQRRAEAYTFLDEAEALAEFTERAATSGGAFEQWIFNGDVRERHGDDFDFWEADEATRDEIIWEWASHDLHSLHRWTLDEAREELELLETAGRQKIHQHLAIAAILRRFIQGATEGGE